MEQAPLNFHTRDKKKQNLAPGFNNYSNCNKDLQPTHQQTKTSKTKLFFRQNRTSGLAKTKNRGRKHNRHWTVSLTTLAGFDIFDNIVESQI